MTGNDALIRPKATLAHWAGNWLFTLGCLVFVADAALDLRQSLSLHSLLYLAGSLLFLAGCLAFLHDARR